MRVIVTGSRAWTDVETIRRALAEVVDSYPQDWHPDGIVLVHGGCNVKRNGRAQHTPPRGADAIANELWRAWGLTREIHKAEWARRGRSAGPIRNKEMVDLGADLCLAFILDESPGATDCARRAFEAGIPVHAYHKSSEGTRDNGTGTAQRGPRGSRQSNVRANRRHREGSPRGSRTVAGTRGKGLRNPA